MALLQLFTGMNRVVEDLAHPTHACSQLRSNKATFCRLASALTLLTSVLFAVDLAGAFAVSNALKCSAEGLSSAPECRKAV